jgi:RNA recognition motif-containing protein
MISAVFKPTNAPRGFCYIRFNRVEDAVKLYESLMKEPLIVQGRTIRYDFDAERPPSIKTLDGQPSTCLMLDHVPVDRLRRPDSIYRAMLAYGDVQDVRVGGFGSLHVSSCCDIADA